jgi:enamine deaminase RidA (YjgF/YER057c/UK114 family)
VTVERRLIASGQARRCFEIISAALAEAGARVRDVVRTRVSADIRSVC